MTNVLVVVTLTMPWPGNYSCGVEWAGAPLQVTHSLLVLQPPAITKPAEGQLLILTIFGINHLQEYNKLIFPNLPNDRSECARQPGRVSAADLPGLG